MTCPLSQGRASCHPSESTKVSTSKTSTLPRKASSTSPPRALSPIRTQMLPFSSPTAQQSTLLTTLYPGSKTKSFSLSSFYYGCDAVLDNGAVSIAVGCKITVTGYRAGSSAPYTTQTFVFTPEEAVNLMNPLTFGKFSTNFQNLVNATFTAEPTSLLDAGVSIDDVVGSTVS